MKKKLVIAGDGEFAEIAGEYFTHDSSYEVAAHAVERAYLTRESLMGRPVVAFEDVETIFAPEEHDLFVAVPYTQLNRVRARLAMAAKAKGYGLASYVSSAAFVWRNVTLGEHCFIFEANVVQYAVSIGNNVILWSGNHVGHRSVIQDNVFAASHVVISGYCTIGRNAFLGVNSTLRDGITIGCDAVVGAGAVVVKDVGERQVVRGNPATPSGADSLQLFGVVGAR